MQLNKGFTLIDLLILITIIGLLAAIAIPEYIEMKERGRLAAIEKEEPQINIQLEDSDGNNEYLIVPEINRVRSICLDGYRYDILSPYIVIATDSEGREVPCFN